MIDLDAYRGDFPAFTFEENQDDVLELVFSNPGKHNALSGDAHAQLAKIWRTIDLDDSVRVVLVRGDGPVFCSGGDLSLVEDMMSSDTGRLRGMKETRDIVVGMIDCSKIIVSAMHGVAVGAGLCVGLLSDISIVTPDVKLIDGHTKFGVAAGDHAALVWPIAMGLAKAKYYALTCRPIVGVDAERAGLVSLCVDNDALLDTARSMSGELVRGAQGALRLTKHGMNGWLRAAMPAYDASLAFEFLGLSGDDVREGVQALRDKRPAVFS